LWIHLICDGPSDIVLGFEPKERGIMQEPPKSLREPILNRLGLSLIGLISTVSATVGLVVFGHFFQVHHDPMDGRSIAFASFAINSMIYIFAYRSMRRSIFHSGPLKANKPLIYAVASGLLVAVLAFLVPGLRRVLGIVPLHMGDWLLVAGVSLSLLAVVEVGKGISSGRFRTYIGQLSRS
jgi:Ca2+-transporting ATPase